MKKLLITLLHTAISWLCAEGLKKHSAPKPKAPAWDKQKKVG